MLRIRDKSNIDRQILNRVQQNTPIQTPTGFARAIMDHVAELSDDIYSELAGVKYLLPSNASGKDLERLVAIWGLSRNSARYAEDSTGNIRFYIDEKSGMSVNELLSILPNSPRYISIPVGTEIYSNDVRFVTTSTGIMSGDSKETLVTAKAKSNGESSNVDSNTLTRHNLDQHPVLGPIAKYIKVTNRLPITNGSYTETDVNLRVRLYNAIRSVATGNRTAIQQAARNVAGVSDCIVIDNIHGVGSTGLLIQSTQPLTSDELVIRVQRIVDNIKPIGENVVVVKPQYRGVEVELGVRVSRNSDKVSVLRDARELGINYINSQPLGNSSFVASELISLIMSINGVEDVQINKLAVGYYDSTRGRNRNVKSVAIGNFRTNTDEKMYTNYLLFSQCQLI